MLNPTLLKLAGLQLEPGQFKTAIVASQAGGPPPGAGGPLPGGPAPGGAPPMDPGMMAAMMGGAQAPGGMPAGMPAPAGMPPAAPPPPGDPSAAPMTPTGAAPAPQAQVKVKAEDWLPKLDSRLFNMQQQLSAIITHLGISISPDSLVLPPGTALPQVEAALPQAGMPPAAPPGGEDPMAAMNGGMPPEMAGGMPPEMGGGGVPAEGATGKQASVRDLLLDGKLSVQERAQAVAFLQTALQNRQS